MTPGSQGWDWFDGDRSGAEKHVSDGAGDAELATVFARCFLSADGRQVLNHLRQLTVERALGPQASEALLRYVEGQRQLVLYVEALVAKGAGGPLNRKRET
ncbi:MAG: hypothetical protein WAS73_05070 [Defluviicoccus sp.]